MHREIIQYKNKTFSRGALGLESKGCWFEPTVRHYFSSNNVRLLAYKSLQVKTHNQNE